MTRQDKRKPDEPTREFDDAPGAEGAAGDPTADVPFEEMSGALPAEPVFTESEVNERVAAATAESKDRHMRVSAEYENFRKRVQREREMWAAEAIERFVADLIQVLDNFDRALAAADSAKRPEAASILEGVRLTEKQLRAVLAKHGVESVDPLGQKFDPRFHEAIQRVPADGVEPGTVTAVFEKGYTIKGRLIRPARVQVAGDS
jgi:molecular chaperone GrpE